MMNRFFGALIVAAMLVTPLSAYALTLKSGEAIGSGGKVGKAGRGNVLSEEARDIAKEFEFKAIGQVAVDTKQRADLLGEEG